MYIESILTIILEEEIHSTLLNIYIGIGAILAGVIIFIAEGYTRDLEQGRILYRISNIMSLLIVYFIGLILFIFNIDRSVISIILFYLFYIVGYSVYLLYSIYTIYNTLKLKTRYNKALLETFDDNITSFLDEIKQTYPTDIDIDIPTYIYAQENKQSHELISHQEGYIKSIDVEGIKKLNTNFKRSYTMSIGREVNKGSTLGYFDIQDKNKKDDIGNKLRSALTIEADENIDNVELELYMIKSTFMDAIKDKKDDILNICKKKYKKFIKLLSDKKINTNIYNTFMNRIQNSYIDYIKEYINTGNTVIIKHTLPLVKDIYIALLETKQYKLLDDMHFYPLYKCTQKTLNMIKDDNNNDNKDVLNTIIYTYINEITDVLQLEIDKNNNNTEAINALETLTTRAIACVLEPILDTIKELYDIDKTKYKTHIDMLIKRYNDCRDVLEHIKHNKEDIHMQLFYHNGYLLYRNCDAIKELIINRYIQDKRVDVNTLMKYFIVFFKRYESYMYDYKLYIEEPIYNNAHHAYIYATRYFIAQALYIIGREINTASSNDVKQIVSDTIKTEYDKELITSVIGYTNSFLNADIKAIPYPKKTGVGAQELYTNIIREDYTLEDMKSDFSIVNSIPNIQDRVINPYRYILKQYLTTLYKSHR